MAADRIPSWLKDIQNRSWEPEILISGITLTFVFLLSNDIYNFSGMLIQDYGVFYGIAFSFHLISVFILTGIKIILVLHLIFRGIWAGMVGLSYVFPKGINRDHLSGAKKDVAYLKPRDFVIRLEKICSLLFSFVFASIGALILSIIFVSPLILLFVLNVDLSIIRLFANAYSVGIIIVATVYVILINTILKNSKLKKMTDNSFFEYIQKIYSTNLGKIKTHSLFAAFILIILLLTYQDILFGFKFRNNRSTKFTSKESPIHLNKDVYESRRNPDQRISKATIDDLYIRNKYLELFIANFKEDTYFVSQNKNTDNNINADTLLTGSDIIPIPKLYQIYMDDHQMALENWFAIDHTHTGQAGFITSIALDSISTGYHELILNKLVWQSKSDSIIRVTNWEIIPFFKRE